MYGAGKKFSHHYGFGLMNAGRAVELAKNWTNIKSMTEIHLPIFRGFVKNLYGEKFEKRFHFAGEAFDTQENKIKFDNIILETVRLEVSIDFLMRGDLEIDLTSPMGTKSRLLFARKHDRSGAGFKKWVFMSVAFWGESPTGTWTLEISNRGRYINYGGSFRQAKMMFTGSNTAETKTQDDDVGEKISSAYPMRGIYNALAEPRNEGNYVTRTPITKITPDRQETKGTINIAGRPEEISTTVGYEKTASFSRVQPPRGSYNVDLINQGHVPDALEVLDIKEETVFDSDLRAIFAQFSYFLDQLWYQA